MQPFDLGAVIIAAIVVGGIVIGVVAQAWVSYSHGSRLSPRRLDALEKRLERMERAIDAVAIEVERVAEAHRFTAKLLSERLESLPALKQPGRVITPH